MRKLTGCYGGTKVEPGCCSRSRSRRDSGTASMPNARSRFRGRRFAVPSGSTAGRDVAEAQRRERWPRRCAMPAAIRASNFSWRRLFLMIHISSRRGFAKPRLRRRMAGLRETEMSSLLPGLPSAGLAGAGFASVDRVVVVVGCGGLYGARNLPAPGAYWRQLAEYFAKAGDKERACGS